MKRNHKYLAVLASMLLVVSVLSVGIVLSDVRTENEVGILVYKRGMDIDALRMNPEYSLLEEYDEFVLVETSRKNKRMLQEKGYPIEPLENRDYVGLHAYSFNVGDGVPEIPSHLEIEGYPNDGSGYYMVQFIGPIRNEWKEELNEMGVIFHEYRHRFNFVVEMNLKTMRNIEKMDYVNWVGIYQPAYRFDHALLERPGTVVLDVYFFGRADPQIMAGRIANIGGGINRIARNRINIEIETEKIENLANFHNVKSIVEGTNEYYITNSDATWIAQTNVQDYRKVTDAGVTGAEQLITVMDSELYGGNSDNPDHECWEDPDGNPVGDNHRKIQEHYIPADAGGDLNDGVYHGTHVTGSVLGNAPPYGEYNKEDGNAMEARVIFQDISDDQCGSVTPPSDMYNDGWGDPYNWGSRVHTNSWGGGSGYGGLAVEGDQFNWDHKDFNLLFAMGNSGDGANSLSEQAEGKNTLSIGSVTNAPDHDDVSGFSSRGYANDGRIKPTLLHVGENLVSAARSYDGYDSMSGTSMATPSAAGQVGQVRHYYEGGWYPSGSANPGDGFNPSGALVRATLINGAVEISGSGAYQNDNRFPNGDQGYGRSMLDRVLHLEGDERKLEVFDSWNEGVELGTGQSWNMDFNVDDPTEELEVTLAWTDYPGAAGSSPAIVNDLDLELNTPGGTRYVGNAFTGFNPGYSAPDPTSNPWNGPRSGEWDGLNVEENILLLPSQNGVETGTYTLTVTAHQVPQGPQPFAVVVSGGISSDDTQGPSIEITRPSVGETWGAGDYEDILWNTEQGDATIDYVDLEYSTDDGASWTFIASVGDTGSYSWLVPDEGTNEARIRAVVYDDNGLSGFDISEQFNIEGTQPPSITLTRPAGGEEWYAGTDEDITWDTTAGDGMITGVTLEYSTDGGGTWEIIYDGADSSPYTWTVPDESSDEAFIRATVHDDNGLSGTDTSGQFTIIGSPPAPPSNLNVEHYGFGFAVLFEDDVESGDLGYTSGTSESPASEWGIRQHGASSGVNSWDFGDGEYYKTSDYGYLSWLISPGIEIPAEAEAVELSFDHWRSFAALETYLDGGNLKISTTGVDGDYTLITPIEGYDGVINDDWGNPLGGQEAWSDIVGWETVTFDLNYYAGETVHLRWDAGIEAYDEDIEEGWRIDNILITAEGVETGDDDHNLLTWDASPDDPDTVSHYNIYCSEFSDGPWDESTLIDSVTADGSASYEYVDLDKGMADDIFWWYVVRAVDDYDQTDGNEDAVQEPGDTTVTFDIELSADAGAGGWNFVSFNLVLGDNSLEAILEDPDYGISGNYDRLMYYDATADSWYTYVPGRAEQYNNLENWDHTMGVWIRMTVDDTLTVEGTEPSQTSITLQPGWNMVGLPSSTIGNHNLPADISRIGYFDAAQEYNLAYDHDPGNFEFVPGEGYWLYNDADQGVDWIIDY